MISVHFTCICRSPFENKAMGTSDQELIPREARVINLTGRAGPSGAKPREFERKIYLFLAKRGPKARA